MRNSVVWFFAVASIVFAFYLLACASGGGDDDDTGGDDDVSGDLTWQEPPSDLYVPWEEAISYCEKLELDGHDDWRLPTIDELRFVIRGCDATEIGGSCGVSDGCDYDCLDNPCGGCDTGEGPGSGGFYWPDGFSGTTAEWWSSSRVNGFDNHAWNVDFLSAAIRGSDVGFNRGVRCVR